ncbi:MAG: PorV/PorQ family protein [Candidatus Cloacimonadota bacterium]|nr:PorV/PorQ family protein [Candidatus Cloacimonadota bacterium]
MNVKKYWLLVIIILSLFVALHADYRDAYQELFFGRQPSSRAEAMGRGYVTIDGDIDTYFYNPAGIANINFMDVKFTTSSPYYVIDKARYYQFGSGYNFNNNIIIGFNVNLMSYGEEYGVVDEENPFEPFKKVTPYLLNYTLTMATPLSENLSVGFNINRFTENYGGDPHSILFFDVGTIYKHKLTSFFASEDEISFGVSIRNFTFSKVKYDSVDEELPAISRFGISYSFLPEINNNTVEVLCQAEYQYLLNYDYRDGLHLGLETKFIEMLSLRCGYYYENIDSDNTDQLTDFTYGLGIDIPVYKFTDYPINLQIDYTSLPQVSYSQNYDLDNFNSFTVKLSWNK